MALTGTGGDEAFGGYRRYWLLGAGPWLRHVPAFVREPVSRVLGRALPQGARLLGAAGDPQGFYRGLLRVQHEPELRALLGPPSRVRARCRRRRGRRTRARPWRTTSLATCPTTCW